MTYDNDKIVILNHNFFNDIKSIIRRQMTYDKIVILNHNFFMIFNPPSTEKKNWNKNWNK
jgi:hypothetical protein